MLAGEAQNVSKCLVMSYPEVQTSKTNPRRAYGQAWRGDRPPPTPVHAVNNRALGAADVEPASGFHRAVGQSARRRLGAAGKHAKLSSVIIRRRALSKP